MWDLTEWGNWHKASEPRKLFRNYIGDSRLTMNSFLLYRLVSTTKPLFWRYVDRGLASDKPMILLSTIDRCMKRESFLTVALVGRRETRKGTGVWSVTIWKRCHWFGIIFKNNHKQALNTKYRGSQVMEYWLCNRLKYRILTNMLRYMISIGHKMLETD